MSAPTGWSAFLDEVLPRHARLAAAPTVAALAAALTDAGPVGDADAVIAVLREALQALADHAETAVEARQTLAAGRRLGQERAAVEELLSSVPGPGSRRGDRRAVRRWMDGEAIEDRLARRGHGVRQRVELLAGVLSRLRPAPGPATSEVIRGLEEIVADAMAPWTLRAAAIGALVPCAALAPDLSDRLRALALDARLDPWVQAAALEASLELVAPETGNDLLIDALSDRGDQLQRHPDHAFFRARAATLAGRVGAWNAVWEALAPEEGSVHVQQAAARALADSPHPEQADQLASVVGEPERAIEVRAAGAIAALDLDRRDTLAPGILPVALAEDAELAAIVLEALADRLQRRLPEPDDAAAWRAAWAPDLARWSAEGVAPDTRVDAAAVALALDVAADPRLRAAWREVRDIATTGREGARHALHHDLREDELLSVLALVARDALDLAARPRGRAWTIYKGSRRVPTAWRIVHELLHPRPDKRQAFSHTVDVLPAGSLLAPSGRVAEVTPTAVPGQPVSGPEQRWWAPDLPLPAWAISATLRGRLRVRALPDVDLTLSPAGSRPVSWVRAQLGALRIDRARREVAGSPGGRGHAHVDQVLSDAGVRVTRRDLSQWLPTLGWPVVRDLWALDASTLTQLGIYAGVLGAGWLGSAVARQAAVRRSRSRIPLVIGGWGSRGKSGTERLKAGLFHELGYLTVSKTTGNEAMVVVGLPGRDPIELFLYRPYERASIVEQREVLHLGARLGAQVLLWECMALNPRYVEILQQDWMRDDLTTLTNTYPDHEDVQGPTGRDVADTIGRMMPRRAEALTTEQAMGPVLADRARDLDTELDIVPPEAWRLLPPDILARFPYAEHPRNIALVTALGARLDVPADVCWRAMADRVVPDLGVLTEYGPIRVHGRIASYVVGNSANERAGFLSNWRRMGMDRVSDGAGLTETQVLVVNNRKDRLPRQEVFARVAALDAPADALLVIGTNVGPFLDAWRRTLRGELRERLLRRTDDSESFVQLVAALLRRPILDRPRAGRVLAATAPTVSEQRAHQRIDAAWEGADPGRVPPVPVGPLTPEAWLEQVAWLAALRARPDRAVLGVVVERLIEHLAARGRAIEDPQASGDAITRTAVETAPTGARVRLMGSANIKGTGMELVVRWAHIQTIDGALSSLRTGGPTARAALLTLRTLDTGRLDGTHLCEGLASLLDSGDPADPGLREEAEAVLADARAHLDATGADGRKGRRVLTSIQQVQRNVDLGAVTRRQSADRVHRDLGRERIGLRRAARVMREIVESQRS